ncbi:MAG: EMC3/TMCO1 family protein [Promethearchaeota archaeon]
MQVNPLVDIAVALRVLLGPWAYPPLSAVTVLLISVLMALITNLVNRRLINFERLRRSREEMRKWQEMKREVTKTDDPRLKRKLQLKIRRKERYMNKLSGELGKQQFKPMMVTIIPFMLVFAIMNGIFINDTVSPAIPYAVIYSPLHFGQVLGQFGMGFGIAPGEFGVPILAGQGLFYIFWYIIVSITANMLFQRILKTSMT